MDMTSRLSTLQPRGNSACNSPVQNIIKPSDKAADARNTLGGRGMFGRKGQVSA